MKKELFAALTILLLIVSSIVNVIYLQKMTADMTQHITDASEACNDEDFMTAHSELTAALRIWLDADDYTHIFIRHSEIDSTSDAFYDAFDAIRCRDGGAASAALEKLSYHLTSILTMEYVTIRSVF